MMSTWPKEIPPGSSHTGSTPRFHPTDFDWLALSVASEANGTKTYTGQYRVVTASDGSTDYYYTSDVVAKVDPQGRLTSWHASGIYLGYPGLNQDTILTCTGTWDFGRPAIAIPRTRNALGNAVREEIDVCRRATPAHDVPRLIYPSGAVLGCTR